MKRAVVYVPPELDRDGDYATQAIGYIKKRGHTFVAVYRSETEIGDVLAHGNANLVIFLRREHWRPGWDVPGDVVEEATRDLNRPVVDELTRQRYGTVHYTATAVQDLPTVRLLSCYRDDPPALRRLPDHNARPAAFPRGDDGGFAERFLKSRRNTRDT